MQTSATSSRKSTLALISFRSHLEISRKLTGTQIFTQNIWPANLFFFLAPDLETKLRNQMLARGVRFFCSIGWGLGAVFTQICPCFMPKILRHLGHGAPGCGEEERIAQERRFIEEMGARLW